MRVGAVKQSRRKSRKCVRGGKGYCCLALEKACGFNKDMLQS